LERLHEDKAIVGFAQKAEGRLVRWLDFAKGALLFLMVPGDSESGSLHSGSALCRPGVAAGASGSLEVAAMR